MANDKPVAGIDLGGTNMQIGVVAPNNELLGREKRKTRPDEGHERVLDRMASAVREASDEAGVRVADLGALGIGVPGAVDRGSGRVLEAPNLGWTDFPIVEDLERRLEIPVVLDNDVNVAVLGEHRLGAGRGQSNLLGVWIGTGIGGGLILDGELYHGGLGTAGEIGQMVLFPKAALGHRTLEQNCSRKHVVERMRHLVESGHASLLRELADDSSRIGSKLVARAYHQHDELTVRVVDEVCEFLGATIASVITLLSLRKVILGGGLTEALGRPFVERIKQAADQHVFPSELRAVEIVPTELEDDAGLLGAALLAREHASSQSIPSGSARS